jgi:hypothetical protein
VVVVLPGALQADHHDRDRRRGVEVDGLAVRAKRGDQFVVDVLTTIWPGVTDGDGGADRLLPDAVDKL